MALYVNNQLVDAKHIDNEIQRLRPEYERVFSEMAQQVREKQLADWARENVIESILLSQEAARQIGLIVPEVIGEEYKKLIEQHGGVESFNAFLSKSNYTPEQIRLDLEKQVQIQRLIEKVEEQAHEPSTKQIRRYYDENIERFTMPMMIRAAHIVMHPGPETSSEQLKVRIEQVYQKLQSGEDFAKLVREYSACPERGGDLGYFTRGQMVQNFEEQVFALEPGQITGIFETEFGFHIAKLIDKRPAVPVPLEQVQDVIKNELVQQARQKAVEHYLDSLRAKSHIEDR